MFGSGGEWEGRARGGGGGEFALSSPSLSSSPCLFSLRAPVFVIAYHGRVFSRGGRGGNGGGDGCIYGAIAVAIKKLPLPCKGIVFLPVEKMSPCAD